MRPSTRCLASPLHLLWLLALMMFGCGDNIQIVTKPSITSFSIEGRPGQIAGNNITVKLPAGTDVTSLTPSITFIGEDLSPPSGITQDFTSPVDYTVTASDGSTRVYTATVSLMDNIASSDKAITEFKFEAAKNSGELTTDVTAVISGTDITATVPHDTDVTALVATFTTTGVSVVVNGTAQVTGTTANDFTGALNYLVTAEDGSVQTYTVTITVAASSAKNLFNFKFIPPTTPGAGDLTAEVPCNFASNACTAIVPPNTDVTDLVASFETTGDTVKIGSTVQVSGVTANNFTTNKVYRVTAADGSFADFTVHVEVALDNQHELTSFGFEIQNNPLAGFQSNIVGTPPTGADTTWNIIVPNGFVLNQDLIPTFTKNGKEVRITDETGTIQVSGVTPQNFSTDKIYTVVAEDGTFTKYTIHLDNAQPGDKEITSFEIDGNNGDFDGANIDVTVANNADLTALIPTITFIGDKVVPGSEVANDFSTSATTRVKYTVFAKDGTFRDYFVKVEKAGASAKNITSFTINGLAATITDLGATGTIDISLPQNTVLTALTPLVEHTGISVSPASGDPVDFSNGPVLYTVTAANGSTKVYTVTVGIVNGNAKVINSFEMRGVQAQISQGNGTINITLPAGTDLTAQSPTIVINGSTISPASGRPQDFSHSTTTDSSDPVTYTVTAGDGSQRTYTVVITLQ